MLKLMKFEFLRKYKLLAMTLITAIALNILAISRGMGGSAMFLGLFPMVLSVLYLVDIIKMYSEDLNKKTGYMLFMTPNSGYKIISSKLLTAVLEGFALLLMYFIFILINGLYIAVSMGNDIDYSQVIKVVDNLLSGSFGFNLGHVLVFLLAALTFLIAFITTVYTAMTIRKSIFSEMKFGGMFSFLIFLAINYGLSFLSSKFFEIISPYYDSIDTVSSTGTISVGALARALLPMILVLVIQAIAFTGISGYLLEKKINL